MEIEPCYIIGNFGVRMAAPHRAIDRKAFQTAGKFVITDAPKSVELTQIEKQGFLFFAGTMTVSKELDLTDTNYHLQLVRNGLNAVEVIINGENAGTICFNGDVIDCSRYLKPGKNQIALRLYGTLRNMMGPHHLAEEHYRVKPSLFYKEQNPWPAPYEWVEDYCFVEVSLSSI